MGEPRSTPQAAEALHAALKDASRLAGGLADTDGDEDRASLLVGLRDVLDYAARVLGAAYGPDARSTLQQARGLSSATAPPRARRCRGATGPWGRPVSRLCGGGGRP